MAIMEAIETVRLESDASSIDFTSLGSYQHLQLVINVRQENGNATRGGFAFQFNNDTASNYGYVRNFSGIASAASGTNYTSSTTDTAIYGPFSLIGGSVPRSWYSSGIYTIMDYRSTTKYKTVIDLTGWGKNGAGTVGYGQNYWESTAAITSLKVINDVWSPSKDLVRGSVVTLYGWNSS